MLFSGSSKKDSIHITRLLCPSSCLTAFLHRPKTFIAARYIFANVNLRQKCVQLCPFGYFSKNGNTVLKRALLFKAADILKGILFFAFSKELLYEGRFSANLSNGHDELPQHMSLTCCNFAAALSINTSHTS